MLFSNTYQLKIHKDKDCILNKYRIVISAGDGGGGIGLGTGSEKKSLLSVVFFIFYKNKDLNQV